MPARILPVLPQSQQEWRKALDELPATPDSIPAFFFAHGSPMLAYPVSKGTGTVLLDYMGPEGTQADFLRDFGPTLLDKYKPRGIVVFSAHWETMGERLVTDYGDENPLLMDYYGFMPELYEVKFTSRGDSDLARRVVELYDAAGQEARTTLRTEPRGKDGRGFDGPGLDHGVFVPFRLMFGETFTSIPIVQVSIDESLDPEINWQLGKAVMQLRKEGILVLSGGFSVHNLEDFSAFTPTTAKPIHKEFSQAVLDAASIGDPHDRKVALKDLTAHRGFRAAHPREEHFIPIYVAAGAGEEGGVKVLSGLYGGSTIAFGL